MLAVTHPIRHPWVDTAGRLSFPSLLHWVPSQSSLVAVVAEALSELSGLQHAGPQSPQPSSSGEAFALTSAPRGTSTKQQPKSHLPRSHSFSESICTIGMYAEVCSPPRVSNMPTALGTRQLCMPSLVLRG